MHEDPHEHYDHVALVSFIAIMIHTIFDGFGIRAGFGISEEVGYAVLFGVALHQIPVSLSLGALFLESRFQRKTQILFLSLFSVSAGVGFLLGDILLSNVGSTFTGIVAAFA